MTSPLPRAMRALVMVGTGASSAVSASPADENAIRYSAQALQVTLAERCGVPDERIAVLTDPTADEAMDVLAEVALGARDQNETLLVFYIGHGLHDGNARLYFATSGASAEDPQQGGLAFRRVSDLLESSSPQGTALFLDCCFSGRVRKDLYRLRYEPFSSSLPSGRFVLTAAGDEAAYLTADGKTTTFTAELTRLLTQGDPRLGRAITAKDCYRHLASVFPSRGLPAPLHFSSGTAEDLVLTENPSYAPPAPEEIEPPDESVGIAPYLGLRAFGPAEAAFFFGRNQMINALVAKVRASDGVVAVVGGSGVGKSSLVHAGLIATLEHHETELWRHRPLQPGSRPLEVLAKTIRPRSVEPVSDITNVLRSDPEATRRWLEAELTTEEPPGTRLLLVVDQCEELFSLCGDEDQISTFTACLEAAARSERVTVVVVLRADFTGHSMAQPVLYKALQDHNVLVPPMTDDEIREAILKPAEQANLTVAPELVDRLLGDARAGNVPPLPGESRSAPLDGPEAERFARRGYGDAGYDAAGVLPLLSHALLETFRHRESRRLTLRAYERTGGLWRAIATTAEEVYTSLAEVPKGQEIARAVLLGMVQLGKDTDDTRRAVRLDDPARELARYKRAAVREVTERLARTRLITLSDMTATLTHEAIIRCWPRLRGWLEENRGSRYLQQQIESAAAEWQNDARNPALLYRGSRLEDARHWADDPRYAPAVAPLVAEFLAHGVRQAYRERLNARRLTRFRRLLVAALAVIMMAAVTAAGYLYVQRNVTRAKQVAAGALNLRTQDVPSSMQMALAGYRMHDDATTRGSLLSTVAAPGAARFGSPGAAPRVVAAATRSPVVAVGLIMTFSSTQGPLPVPAVELWSVSNPHRPVRLPIKLDGPTHAVRGVTFSEDGTLLAGTVADGDVYLWRIGGVRSGRVAPVKLAAVGKGFSDVGISADNRWLMAMHIEDGVPYLWDLRSPGQAFPLTGPDGKPGDFETQQFVPGGSQIIAIDEHNVWIWSSAAAHASRPRRLAVDLPGELGALGFSHDGQTMALGSLSGPVGLWSISNPQPPRRLGQFLIGHVNSVHHVAFAPDGRTLASGGTDGTIRIWDTADGHALNVLPQPSSLRGLAYTSTGALMSLNSEAQAVVWDLPGPVISTAAASVSSIAFAPSGRTLAVGGDSDRVTLWSVNDSHHRTLLSEIRPGGSTLALAFAPDAPLLATVGKGWKVHLWDVGDPRHPRQRGTVDLKMTSLPTSIAFAPGRHMMAVSSFDTAVYLADVADPDHPVSVKRLSPQAFKLRFAEVKRVAFDPSGRTLAVGCLNGVYLWDVTDPRRPRSLGPNLPGSIPVGTGQLNTFSQVAFSRDGRYVAAGGATSGRNNHAVLLWDVRDRRHPNLTAELAGPSDIINSVAFSRNGRTLAAAGYDHAVWIWDIADHDSPQLIGQLQQHTHLVNTVAFGDGSLLASGSSDSTVRLWETDVPKVARQACLLSGDRDLLQPIWNRFAPEVPYKSPCA